MTNQLIRGKKIKFLILFGFLITTSCNKNQENEIQNEYIQSYFDTIHEININKYREQIYYTFLESKKNHDSFNNLDDPSYAYRSAGENRVKDVFEYFKIKYPEDKELSDEFKADRSLKKIKKTVDSVLNLKCKKDLYSHKMKGIFETYNFKNKTVYINCEYELFLLDIQMDIDSGYIYKDENIKPNYSIGFMPDPNIFNSSDPCITGVEYNPNLFTIKLNETVFEGILDKLKDREVYVKIIYDICPHLGYDLSVLDNMNPNNTTYFHIKFVQLFKDSLYQSQIGTIGPNHYLYIKSNNKTIIAENNYSSKIQDNISVIEKEADEVFIKAFLRNILIIGSILIFIFIVKSKKNRNK
jgi:hypothetical protein